MGLMKNKNISLFVERIHFEFTRQWFQYTSRKRAIILTVHRTTEGRVWEEKYNNSPQYLYKLFALMKQRGFHFVSIDDVMSDKPLKQPAVTVVSDDGFADNLYEAIPVFRELHIPYCMFLSPGTILREDVTLEAMAEFMMDHPDWKAEGVNRGATPESDKAAFEAVIRKTNHAKTLSEIKRAKKQFMQLNNTKLEKEMEHLYLNKQQVEEMAKDPLCTIGVHSYSHAQLRRMTDAELLHNTVVAKNVLEEMTGRQIRHFAYPFGGFKDNYFREFKAVKSAGFESGFMFYEGVFTEKFKKHAYMLPRIQINSSMMQEENIRKYEKLL